MAFVHCMLCFTFPSKDVKFYFSSCAHVACFRCVKAGCFTLKCKVCEKENPRVVEINSQLSPDIADLFTSVEDSIKKLNDDMTRILNFQEMHRGILVNGLYKKFEFTEKLKAYGQSESKKKNEYKMKTLRMAAYNKQATDTIAKLTAQLKSVTTGPGSAAPNLDATKDRSLNLTAMTHDPFRTPAPRGGHRSFITSTPIRADASMADGDKSTINASLSFSAATGIPKESDTTYDFSMLANKTEAVHLNESTLMAAGSGGSGGKKRVNLSTESLEHNSGFPTQRQQNDKVPSSTKKTRLDILSKTQPLPLK